jgi:hypothetical protein
VGTATYADSLATDNVSGQVSPRAIRCTVDAFAATGTIATFIAWQKAAAKQQQQQQLDSAVLSPAVPPLMLAGYAGCLTMRAAAVLSYKAKGRSMVAGDMIEVLGDPVLQHSGLLARHRKDDPWMREM